jgi:serine/threonine-protein phosphatase 2A regulatory subunit A
MENNNPFEFFKEELDSDDLSVRVNTIHKIPIIATLMSTDAIKNTLLPYLDALVKKEDDEVVFAIA